MLFNSLEFLLFFPIVFIIYAFCPARYRYVWLLVASYFFYMSWDWRYGFLMLLLTVVTWVSAKLIASIKGKERRKAALIISAIVCFGTLFIFKYLDFALMIIGRLIKIRIVDMTIPQYNIIVPVGISFFTFQSFGYVYDVYRGDSPVERNFLKYALFVSFFPQLIAGPIERTKNLLNQINEIPSSKLMNYQRITDGLTYMLYGFFLKLVIADRISILVDTVFNDYLKFGGIELMVAAAGFSIQIYCDFASYSIIAIGSAQVMGFNLMENFHAPYLSASIKEFWRNWHISLSTWFRDYLYIPLGGNRKGKLRKYCNLLFVFLISGLWHGASMHFVIWGGIHGVYQIIGEILTPVRNEVVKLLRINRKGIIHRSIKIVSTFVLTTIAWVFFRAKSVHMAMDFLVGIARRLNIWAIWDGTLYKIGLSHYEMNVLLISCIFVLLVDLVLKKKGMRIDDFLNSQGTLAKDLVIILLILTIGIYGIYGAGYDAKQFIYFQF